VTHEIPRAAIWCDLILLAAPLIAPLGLAAQLPVQGSASDPGSHTTQLRAAAATEAQLDGRLTDSAWSTADSLADFRQRDPAEGDAGTERTVVRVLSTPEALYVGVWAEDRDVQAVRATVLRRDADLTVDDYITILIDSFHDRRGAFLFRTNPNGAMWDAQLSGFENLNESWNGIWDVSVARDSAGWTAEFRIPYQTLRFPRNATSLGFNVQRFIRRKNEEVLWQSYRRTEGLFQLLHEGALTGLAPLRRGRPLELMPYVLAKATANDHDPSGASLGGGGVSPKAGVDAKLAVSPTLTADFTVNTDFAQVEADSQVINLTRFPVFFPEKREFFLESSGIFDFGTLQQVQLFYSRRIGLRADGLPVPILAGARLSGKAGPWALGFLDARTGSGDEANALVLRAKHDLFERGYVGAMALQRSGPGVAGAERGAGFDIDLPLVVHGQNLVPFAWIAGTQVPGVPGTPKAWRVATDYPNDLFDNFVSLYRINAGFTPTLGFVRRTGIWETTGHVDFMPRPKTLGIRQLVFEFPVPTWDIIAHEQGSLFHSGDWQTATLQWIPLGATMESDDHFEIDVLRLLDAPPDSFEVFRSVHIAPGRYWWTRGQFQYMSSPGRPLSVTALLGFGGFYDGTDLETGLEATWRKSGHLTLAGGVDRSEVSLPAAHFTALQATGRIEYAFNTRTVLLAFLQYNNEAERIDFNLRFHWIPVIGDDIYVVWNSGFTTDPTVLHRFPSPHALGHPLNGALVVKAVHRIVP
jgi:hypothetical protein